MTRFLNWLLHRRTIRYRLLSDRERMRRCERWS